ncbi:hypothetical protein Thivi_3110 [Thiocystis violascens DSM 198]|uniref:SIR2-like domain-containing protein n=1 Tax=Thiocystis violascens (strain ATCC 17096 / DSM 198 / 6111) TaxID=765911 RepID=I3YDB9_THIV6|nr:hypothetical protein Thivi_3110 [Thiocystis violascens DSM 198]
MLFCGAGLSVGSVPGAAVLYRDCHQGAEDRLGLSGLIDHGRFQTIDAASRLYAWADAVLDALEQRGDSLPKLRLARALGLLDDPKWWGLAEIDFRGNSPRHRVIARFAKEGLWRSLWSFNWDCILENTLEQIGLPKRRPAFETPWEKDHYAIHLHSVYFPATIHPRGLVVHKPHGCVRALRVADIAERDGDLDKAEALSYRLMIGERELKDRSADTKAIKEDGLFASQLGSAVPATLNMILGWSLGEESLMKQLEVCVNYMGTRIAILDPTFSGGHERLRLCLPAAVDQSQVHFKLDFLDCPNRDDIFLWQQSLYTLERLECVNGGTALLDRNGNHWRSTVAECPRETFFCAWADEFLPVWTRLCWSAGLVEAEKMRSHRIDLERRDEHIPLGYNHVARPDLQAAITMLERIPGLGRDINVKDWPGGLFYEPNQTLVVPLPCWGDINELRALRPLVDALRRQLGYVQRLAVWPLDKTATCSDDKRSQHLVERLAALMPVPEFADPGNIRIIHSMEEVSHASH